jgi:hypothetical protein
MPRRRKRDGRSARPAGEDARRSIHVFIFGSYGAAEAAPFQSRAIERVFQQTIKHYCTTRVMGVVCENDPEVADTMIV